MNKIIYYCQIALRIGKAASGSRLIPAIQKRSVYALIYSEALGSNQKKKLLDKSSFYQVPVIALPMETFNKISHGAAMAYGIQDRGLAEKILELCSANQDDSYEIKKEDVNAK